MVLLVEPVEEVLTVLLVERGAISSLPSTMAMLPLRREPFLAVLAERVESVVRVDKAEWAEWEPTITPPIRPVSAVKVEPVVAVATVELVVQVAMLPLRLIME